MEQGIKSTEQGIITGMSALVAGGPRFQATSGVSRCCLVQASLGLDWEAGCGQRLLPRFYPHQYYMKEFPKDKRGYLNKGRGPKV